MPSVLLDLTILGFFDFCFRFVRSSAYKQILSDS